MRLRTLTLLSFGIVAAAQIVPVSRANPPAESDLGAPLGAASLLHRACYDCHSNQTQWPWYSSIAPISWIVSRHVTRARQRLNFSEWADYASDPNTASHKLAEIADEVASGKMAPWYYRMTHPRARLSPNERQELIRWARTASASAGSAN
jgi:Haem-binding domain